MKRFLTPAVFSVFCFLASDAAAGLINVNFTSTLPTAPAFDGTGALGSGVWNRIQAASGGGGDDAGDSNRLKDSAGATSSVKLTGSRSGVVAGTSAVNGNALQDQSWIGNSPNALIFIDVDGLIPGQIYKVVVYSNRVGSGAPADSYLVGAETLSLGNPGALSTELPGVSGVDYLVFFPTASNTGAFTLIAQSVAAMQIAGRLTKSEAAPRLDAAITMNAASISGKGAGKNDAKEAERQTLSQKAKRKTPVKFYTNVVNKGVFVDTASADLDFREKDLKVIVRDLTSGGNVTASALLGEYLFRLDAGEIHRFQMQLKPLRENKKSLVATLCVLPSTKESTLSDCVTGQIRF